ncbi:hypothetical protein Gotri_027618 [Gossypium trilobum]|uniref:Uncharacterized protein n=1 Tax=Gossypium trilobum TaxID=34281 RepID=A0A7J9FM84_9ROSI|nr:hypothetical protein [Gossypium trilobum]
MAVYVNLGKALTYQVLINGVLQRIEYEYLPPKKIINGVAREKMQENIRFQLLETLNDKMGSHENRPTKEINMTQKELGSAEESIAAQTRTPHWPISAKTWRPEWALNLEKQSQQGLMQFELRTRKEKETDVGAWEETQTAITLQTRPSEEKSGTSATEVKTNGAMEGRQIIGETHGTQPAAILDSHPRHRFNAESLLAVAVEY